MSKRGIGIGTEVAPNALEARHGAGQRRHRWRGFAARQMADASADAARKVPARSQPQCGPVELGISERAHYRDIVAITAKGVPIYGVDIDVLQFVVTVG